MPTNSTPPDTPAVSGARRLDQGSSSAVKAGEQELKVIRLLEAADANPFLSSLKCLLQSCVNLDPSTSSIGFLAPLSDADADEYWRSVVSKLDHEPRACYLFVVTEPGRTEVLATVQLFTIPKRTHAHRGEIAKLMVRPSAQRRGLGKVAMEHVETFASDVLKLQLLTLDTETSTPGRTFYNRIGWTEWGTCPAYAAFADGRLGSATFFRKILV